MADKISLTRDNISYIREAFSHFFPEDVIYSADKPYTSGEFNWENRKAFIDFIYRLTGLLIVSKEDFEKDDFTKIDFGSVKKAELAVEDLVKSEETKGAEALNSEKLKELEENEKTEATAEKVKETQTEAARNVQAAIDKKTAIAQAALRQKAAEEAKKQQEGWAKLQEQKLPEVASKEIQAQVLQELKGKVLYAIPENVQPQIVLSKDELRFIKIAKANPQVFTDKLTKLIIKKNPDIPIEILQPLSQTIAVQATKGFINPANKAVPTGVFASILNAKNLIPGLGQNTQDEIAKTTAIFTVFSESKENLSRAMLERSIGTNLTNTLLGFSQTTYKLSDTPVKDGFQLKLDQLQTNSFSLQEGGVFKSLNNPVFDIAKSTAKSQIMDFTVTTLRSLPQEGFLGSISRFSNSQAFDAVAPLLGVSTQATYVGVNFFGTTIANFLPEYAPLIENLAGAMGIDLGIVGVTPEMVDVAVMDGIVPVAGTAAGEAGVGVLGQTAIGLAAKVGLSSVVAPVVTAMAGALNLLNGIVPGLGVVVSAIVIKIFGKAIEAIALFVKKHQEDLKIVGGVMLGGGLILGSVPAVIVGGLVFVPTVISTGFSLAGIVSRSIHILGRIAGYAFKVATPVIIVIAVIPILVAITLIIINSGAYVVPPTSSTASNNPYISVEKAPNPKGPFQNSDLPVTVDYTITITAKSAPLTNVQLNYKCEVLRKGTKPNCPDIGSAIPNATKIGTISPSASYSFDYKMTYSGDLFKDSLIVDTITALADTPSNKGVTTSGSASIIIGKPDVGCFKILTTGQYAVPPEYMKMYNDAIFKIMQDWPTYVAKVCSSSWPEVDIGYGGPNAYWGWHLHSASVDLILYQQPVSTTLVRSEFTLLHELGHHIEAVNPAYYSQYLDYPGIVIPICTYSATWTGDDVAKLESFAETMGLYGSGRALSDSLSCAGDTETFKEKYPINWKFADTVMFH